MVSDAQAAQETVASADTALNMQDYRTHVFQVFLSLQWRHNERDGVSNHQRLDCLLNKLFRRRSKNHACGFPTQSASNAENVSIWWRHHV